MENLGEIKVLFYRCKNFKEVTVSGFEANFVCHNEVLSETKVKEKAVSLCAK
jgi:hypothetical protein